MLFALAHRLVASSLLAFAAFLRYDELAKLSCKDVTFLDLSLSVRIVFSRIDQYRQSDTFMVAYANLPTSPVAMTGLYFP